MKASNFVIVFIMYVGFLPAMEKPQQSSSIQERPLLTYEIKVGTFSYTVVLIKDNIYDMKSDIKPDVVVVGINAQLGLVQPGRENTIVERLSKAVMIGGLYTGKTDSVLVKNENCESDSDDDTYRPCGENMTVKVKGEIFVVKDPWNHTDKKKIKGVIALIGEPCIFSNPDSRENHNNYLYTRQLQGFCDQRFYGQDALEKASADLGKCYVNILQKAKEYKSIAFSALGTFVGFPGDTAAKVAVSSVFNCLKLDEQKGNLKIIYFVMKKRADYDRYKDAILKKQLPSIQSNSSTKFLS